MQARLMPVFGCLRFRDRPSVERECFLIDPVEACGPKLGLPCFLLVSRVVLVEQSSRVAGERQQGVTCSGRSVLVRAWPALHVPAPLSGRGLSLLSVSSSRRLSLRVLGRQLMGNLCRYALRKRITLFSRLPRRLVDSPFGSSLPGWLARRSGLRERFPSTVSVVEPFVGFRSCASLGCTRSATLAWSRGMKGGGSRQRRLPSLLLVLF